MTPLKKFDHSKHHRRSIRLKGYDYKKPGFYFITLNTFKGEKLFGKIEDGKMMLNEFGQLVDFTWQDLPNHNNHVRLDSYVIMPEHFHGIIELTDSNGAGDSPVRHPLSEVIRQFKTFSVKRINMLRSGQGDSSQSGQVLNLPRLNLPQPVWQRDYYERIIRNKKHLNTVRNYIEKNPSKYRKV